MNRTHHGWIIWYFEASNQRAHIQDEVRRIWVQVLDAFRVEGHSVDEEYSADDYKARESDCGSLH